MQLIETILGKRNNIRVLRHLVKHKNWQFNITELSKDLKINKGILSRLIFNLEKENIIKVTKKGKIKLLSINKDNLFIKEIIIPIFEKEDAFYYNMIDKLVKKLRDNVVSVILYGSLASKNFKLTSDVDVLLIAKRNDRISGKKLSNIKKEFLDNDLLLRIDIMSVIELKRLYKTNEPFIKSVIKNNKLLYGRPIMELLNEN